MSSISFDISAAVDEPFDGINPIDTIPLLLALPVSDCLNGKLFWKTFKKWESLSSEQKNKCAQFWKHNISPDVRNRLSEAARAIIIAEAADENTR